MGDEAAKVLDEATQVSTETPEPAESIPTDEAGDGDGAPAEFEVVRAGSGGSQPDKQLGVRKRINKLNAKVETANDATAEVAAALKLEQQKTQLLELSVAELRADQNPAIPPDPLDFDDGARDPKYARALNAYHQPIIAAEVEKRIPTRAAQEGAPSNTDLERRQTNHYGRAADLKVKDFNETEDKAIDVLGKGTVNQIIQHSDQSHLLLYYLGKNPDVAEDLKSQIDNDPTRATLRIGRLEAELSVRPKANSGTTPNPDEELEGTTPSAGKGGKALQKRLDALRTKAAQSGPTGSAAMGEILALKRKAQADGVTVT